DHSPTRSAIIALPVTFTHKYVVWLLVPPAVVMGPLSFLFLTQIVRMSLATSGSIFGLFALFFLAGSATLVRGLTPLANAVDEDVCRGKDASEAASRCLERT